MVKYPKIVIKDAWLLRENASKHLHELWAGPEDKLAEDDWMAEKVKAYQDAWRPYEQKILKGMCDIYGIEFKQNIIDVYIAPWFSAFSDPLVIGVMYEPDVFVDTLAHELLHRLFTCNNIISVSERPGVLLKAWKKAVPGRLDDNTRIHIPVHAGLKELYLDVLRQPMRLDRDIAASASVKEPWMETYKQAWDYVNLHGYKEINSKVAQLYKDIK